MPTPRPDSIDTWSLVKVDPAAIVGHLDDRVGAMVVSPQRNTPGLRFATGLALFGRLDAMVYGVAQEVEEWVGQLVDQHLVKFCLRTAHLEPDLLAYLPPHLADLRREVIEQVGDRDHAEVHGAGLQAHAELLEVLHVFLQALVNVFEGEQVERDFFLCGVALSSHLSTQLVVEAVDQGVEAIGPQVAVVPCHQYPQVLTQAVVRLGQAVEERPRVQRVQLMQGLLELIQHTAERGHVILQTNTGNEDFRRGVQHIIKLFGGDANAFRDERRPGLGRDRRGLHEGARRGWKLPGGRRCQRRFQPRRRLWRYKRGAVLQRHQGLQTGDNARADRAA